MTPKGSKLWRFDCRHEAKRGTLALGKYPDISLADARIKRDEARQLLARGVDPGAERAANNFEVIAREWLEKNVGKWAETTHRHIKERLENNLSLDWLQAHRRNYPA